MSLKDELFKLMDGHSVEEIAEAGLTDFFVRLAVERHDGLDMDILLNYEEFAHNR